MSVCRANPKVCITIFNKSKAASIVTNNICLKLVEKLLIGLMTINSKPYGIFTLNTTG